MVIGNKMENKQDNKKKRSPTRVKCDNCGYEWNYKGSFNKLEGEFFITCSRCQRKTKVKINKREKEKK